MAHGLRLRIAEAKIKRQRKHAIVEEAADATRNRVTVFGVSHYADAVRSPSSQMDFAQTLVTGSLRRTVSHIFEHCFVEKPAAAVEVNLCRFTNSSVRNVRSDSSSCGHSRNMTVK
jgi:hypothetical protein